MDIERSPLSQLIAIDKLVLQVFLFIVLAFTDNLQSLRIMMLLAVIIYTDTAIIKNYCHTVFIISGGQYIPNIKRGTTD